MGLVGTPVGEDHHDQLPLRGLDLEARPAPVGTECVVQPLKQRRTPLGVVAAGVETDNVVLGNEQIEAGRQGGEHLPPQVLALGRDVDQRLPCGDAGGRKKFVAAVVVLEEQAAVHGLDHDRSSHDPPVWKAKFDAARRMYGRVVRGEGGRASC